MATTIKGLAKLFYVERARGRVLQCLSLRPSAWTHVADIRRVVGDYPGLKEALEELFEQKLIDLQLGEERESDREHVMEIAGRRVLYVNPI